MTQEPNTRLQEEEQVLTWSGAIPHNSFAPDWGSQSIRFYDEEECQKFMVWLKMVAKQQEQDIATALHNQRKEITQKVEEMKDELTNALYSEFHKYMNRIGGNLNIGEPVIPRKLMLESKIAVLSDVLTLLSEDDTNAK